MATQDRGVRPSVLVVEDEFIIALDVAETVKDLGYVVEGPFVSQQNALRALDGAMPDLAILDVFTADGEVYPLADVLTSAGVPIIFHSGHMSAEAMRARYPEAQAVCKPCPPDQLIGLLQLALEKDAGSTH